MARKVRCHITGEYGTSETFYKAKNGKYYKSKELYDTWNKENEDRKYVIGRFATEFLDYVPGQVFPTILTKKLKELEFYGYVVIKKTINKSYDSIQYALKTKEFKNEANKISYIFAIIKNNINDVYKQVLAEEKSQKKQEKQVINMDIDDEKTVMNIGTKQKAKDISCFLEDDEWI